MRTIKYDYTHTAKQEIEKIQALIEAVRELEGFAFKTNSTDLIRFEITSIAEIADEAEACLNTIRL